MPTEKKKSGTPRLLWQPGSSFVNQSRLTHFNNWLRRQRGLLFEDYHAMWQWSVDQPAAFWEAVSQYFEVMHHRPYHAVLSRDPMPDANWFEGSALNYAEHIFRRQTAEHPAIIFQSESQPLTEISWQELRREVAALRFYLKSLGVEKGDRVVAYLPNIPEATIAFLATCSLGAIWSSCSPDFGVDSVVDRFRQVDPKVLFVVDGYRYGGKSYDKTEAVRAICEALPSLEKVIFLPYLDKSADHHRIPKAAAWKAAVKETSAPLEFEVVPFGHPIWILYSSGTTGIPKAITHSHGGVLLEHLKYLAFHNDVHPGERFFWFSTTGWMMWNFVQASFLMGATIVLYDGNPGYPDMNVLWKFAEQARIVHFGTSPPFLVACMKQDLRPGKQYDLDALRSVGSTGAPLPPEAFDWVYGRVGKEIWLSSISGGTDLCTAFVGGCPWEPVYEGEIQCRALGCALYAFDEEGHPVINEVGEMVITRPMPSMPIFFWGDDQKRRYRSSYFEMFPGVWRHGDWVKITDRHSLIIYGRSDATLNRQGVRIGTAEIYQTMNKIEEVEDSLIVNLELSGGRHFMPLFVVLREGYEMDTSLEQRIRDRLRQENSPRHVPDEIIVIREVPYTISGKKLEAPVKKILLGRPVEKAANPDALKNPKALDFFVDFAKRIQ
jgi:acetoacetyl-CoA synthetase